MRSPCISISVFQKRKKRKRGQDCKLDNSSTADSFVRLFRVSDLVGDTRGGIPAGGFAWPIIAPSGSTSSLHRDATCTYIRTYILPNYLPSHCKRSCEECAAEGWKEGDSKKGRAACVEENARFINCN